MRERTNVAGMDERLDWPIDDDLRPSEDPDDAERSVPEDFLRLESALRGEHASFARLRRILKSRPDLASGRNRYGCTPLMLVEGEAAGRLLLPLCDPLAADDDGATALIYAAINGDFGLVKLLSEAADHEAVDRHGATALACAVRHGAGLPVVELLLARGDARKAMKCGATPLIWAQMACRGADMTRLLIPASDLDASDAEGSTALMWAASNASLPDAELLLEAGADPLARDARGRDALSWACSKASQASGRACMQAIAARLRELGGADFAPALAEARARGAGEDVASWLESLLLEAGLAPGHGALGRSRKLRI